MKRAQEIKMLQQAGSEKSCKSKQDDLAKYECGRGVFMLRAN